MTRRVADLTADEIARAGWERRSWTGVAVALGFSQPIANAVRIRAHVLGIHDDLEALPGWGRAGRKRDTVPVMPEACPETEPTRPRPVDVDDERAWMADGACRGADPALFFPGRGEDTRAAKAVCAGCAVRDVCLEYALDAGEKWGIWGGRSERERRKMRAARFGAGVKRVTVRHGTETGYSHHGCRCDECRGARARADEGRRAAKRALVQVSS